jgi:glycosyltransferase involved in cell wall biosynthesis
MPVYNAGPLLEPAVRSILAQTLTDLELIAVDDGSTDGSGDVLDSIAREDARVIVVHAANRGVSSARNLGVTHARADLVAAMDGDDLALPDRLARQVAFLQEHPSVAAVGCGLRIIDARGEPQRSVPAQRWSEVRPDRFTGRFDVGGPTIVIRRGAFDAVGGYRTAMDGSEDHDLIVRLIDDGFVLDNVTEELYLYRIHSGQASNVSGAQQRLAVIAADVAREFRRRRATDPFDETASLIVPSWVIVRLPRDLRPSVTAIGELAGHLERLRHAGGGRSHGSTPRPRIRDFGWRAWTSDVMHGVHRDAFFRARRQRDLRGMMVSAVPLLLARRRRSFSPELAFLPQP